jgi:hypothetical protein
VWLVNARDVKHLPGRGKSDKADCVWLCKLNERGCCAARSCRRRRPGIYGR